jgi:putative oxidoreductase
MTTSLERWAPYGLSLLRIVAALLFIEHGLQKFFGFPSSGPTMSLLLWIQAAIELFGGAALLVGAYTRSVAFILCGDMAAAYFIGHFPRSFYPAVNGGDSAILYCFIFLYLVLAGSGPWSVDEAVLTPSSPGDSAQREIPMRRGA